MAVANSSVRVAKGKGISKWWVAGIIVWVGLLVLALRVAPWRGERIIVFDSPQYQNKTVYLFDRDKMEILWVVTQSTPEKEVFLALDNDRSRLRVWQPTQTGGSGPKTLASFHFWSARQIDEVSYISSGGITVQTGRNFSAVILAAIIWVIYSFVLLLLGFLGWEEANTRKRYNR